MKSVSPFVITISALILFDSALADDTPFDTKAFQFRRALSQTEPDSEREGLGFFRVDPHIYQNSAKRLTDLRLVKIQSDGTELEWPYVIKSVEKSVAEKRRIGPKKLPSKILSFEEDKDNHSIEIVYKILPPNDSPKTISSLKVTTPLRNFEKQISIYGSEDQANWNPIIVNQLIFDRSQFVDFRATTIQFPDRDYSFVKIRINRVTDRQIAAIEKITKSQSGDQVTRKIERKITKRAFRIDNIDFYSPPKEVGNHDGIIRGDDFQYDHDFPITLVENDTGQNTTRIYFEGGNLPLVGLSVTTEDRNFRRHFSLQAKDPDFSENWNPVTTGTIHRYDIAGFYEENLDWSLNHSRSKRYRMVIQNLDNPPIKIENLVGTFREYRAVFLSLPSDQFQIYYGKQTSDRTKTPNYDRSAIQAALFADVPLVAFQTGDPTRKLVIKNEQGRTELNPWILRGVMLLILVMLAALLFNAEKFAGGTER